MGGTFFKKRYVWVDGRDRAQRQKTFKTEEAAKKYAEANNIKKYELENLKSSEAKEKKIRIKMLS